MQLLVDDFEQRPWTVSEIISRTGEEPDVTLASLNRLLHYGLVHWPGNYLVVSRPARYYFAIAALPDDPSQLLQ